MIREKKAFVGATALAWVSSQVHLERKRNASKLSTNSEDALKKKKCLSRFNQPNLFENFTLWISSTNKKISKYRVQAVGSATTFTLVFYNFLIRFHFSSTEGASCRRVMDRI